MGLRRIAQSCTRCPSSTETGGTRTKTARRWKCSPRYARCVASWGCCKQCLMLQAELALCCAGQKQRMLAALEEKERDRWSSGPMTGQPGDHPGRVGSSPTPPRAIPSVPPVPSPRSFAKSRTNAAGSSAPAERTTAPKFPQQQSEHLREIRAPADKALLDALVNATTGYPAHVIVATVGELSRWARSAN
jgi:hypothetical protein